MIRLITCNIDSLPYTAIHIRISLNLLSYIWIKTRIMILDICFIWNKVISNITSGVCTRLTSLFPSLVSSHHAIRPPLTIVLLSDVCNGYSQSRYRVLRCWSFLIHEVFGTYPWKLVWGPVRFAPKRSNLQLSFFFSLVSCGKEWNFTSFNHGYYTTFFCFSVELEQPTA